MPDEQSEAATIEAIKGLIPDDSYNIGQAEETPEAKPAKAAEPQDETEEELEPSIKMKDDDEDQEVKVDMPEPDEEIEVEIKGQKYKAPKALQELIMFQSDYTKKTMALAEEKKALDAERGKIDPNVVNELQRYKNLLGDAVMADQQVDWLTLARTDPAGYVEKKALADMRAAEFQQVRAEDQQKFAVNIRQAADKEWGQLIAKRPDLKEAAAFKAHDEKLRSALSKDGYSNEQINEALFDHRARMWIDDAIKYRDLQSQKTETVKRIEKLPPKVERPGVPSGTDGQVNKTAMTNLRKTGKIDDAAAAIRALMG